MLVSRVGDDETAEIPLLQSRSHTSIESHSFRLRRSRMVFICVCFIVFAINCGAYLTSVPSIRIIEDIVCHHYYERTGRQELNIMHSEIVQSTNLISGVRGTGDIDERLCKVKEVQHELAMIGGILQLTQAIPGAFLAVPYGLLADRIGRKPVLALAIIGMLLNHITFIIVCWFWHIFPVHLLVAGPIFYIIGGGGIMMNTMLHAVVADITPENDRATAFFRMAVPSVVSEILAPSVASFLMKYSPWIPLLLGELFVTSSLFFVMFLPETLHLRSPDKSIAEDPIQGVSTVDGIAEAIQPDFLSTSQPKINLKRLTSWLARFVEVISSVALLLLISTFLAKALMRQAIDLFLQYFSVRFGWSLSHTGFLLSLRAGVDVLVLLAVLPYISSALLRIFKLNGAYNDLALAKMSSLCLIFGAVIIGGSPSKYGAIAGLVVYTFGTGFWSLVLSMATALVPASQIASLYATISVVDQLGAFVAGPTIAGIFGLGLNKGGAWIGLPYYAVATMITISSSGLWYIKFQDKDDVTTAPNSPVTEPRRSEETSDIDE